MLAGGTGGEQPLRVGMDCRRLVSIGYGAPTGLRNVCLDAPDLTIRMDGSQPLLSCYLRFGSAGPIGAGRENFLSILVARS
jgi:hypothetical protein